jgi:hypothetical protein
MTCENNCNAQPIVGTAIFPEQKSSVEISKNAKGDTQYSIKVYDADPSIALERALGLRKSIEERLQS